VTLTELQQCFLDAMLSDDDSVKHHVVEQGELSREQRVSIYKNAYKARLTESIETDHEILGIYLGDELFEQMAQGYIKTFPSNNRSLRNFSNHLPEYLKQISPFKEHPVIAELARFERRLLDAFDAADAKRATLDELKLIPEHCWPTMTFRLHPSAQLFTTDYNCVECWQALKVNQIPPEPNNQIRNWLIWRNHERLTEFMSLTGTELQILEFMLSGKTFADICNKLANNMPEQEVSAFSVESLISWLNKGIIRSLITQ
jgi:hypothetical protein